MLRFIADILIAFTLLTLTWALGYLFFRVSERLGFVNALLLNDSRVLCLACRILRVEWFRWLLVNTPLRYTSDKMRVHNHSNSELIRVRREMVDSEVSHHFAFWLCALAVSVYLTNGGRMSLSVVLSTYNVIGNLYPALVQTRSRSRLDTILEYRGASVPSESIF